MSSPAESLKNYMREKGSISVLDAQIYLRGCGCCVSYELTKNILKGFDQEGFSRHIGSHDTYGSPVHVVIE